MRFAAACARNPFAVRLLGSAQPASPGRLIVQHALAAGHEVTALARDPGKMGAAPECLRVLRGAADDVDAIKDRLRNADVVVSAMGSGNSALTTFGENAISAMRRAHLAHR